MLQIQIAKMAILGQTYVTLVSVLTILNFVPKNSALKIQTRRQKLVQNTASKFKYYCNKTFIASYVRQCLYSKTCEVNEWNNNK